MIWFPTLYLSGDFLQLKQSLFYISGRFSQVRESVWNEAFHLRDAGTGFLLPANDVVFFELVIMFLFNFTENQTESSTSQDPSKQVCSLTLRNRPSARWRHFTATVY